MSADLDSDNPYESPHATPTLSAAKYTVPDRRRAAKLGFIGMMLGCAVGSVSGAIGATALGVVAVSFAGPDPNSIRPSNGSILVFGALLGAGCGVALGAIVGTGLGVCVGWDRSFYSTLYRLLFGLVAAFSGAVIGTLAGEIAFSVVSLPEATGVPYGVAIGATAAGAGAVLTDYALVRWARDRFYTGEIDR